MFYINSTLLPGLVSLPRTVRLTSWTKVYVSDVAAGTRLLTETFRWRSARRHLLSATILIWNLYLRRRLWKRFIHHSVQHHLLQQEQYKSNMTKLMLTFIGLLPTTMGLPAMSLKATQINGLQWDLTNVSYYFFNGRRFYHAMKHMLDWNRIELW